MWIRFWCPGESCYATCDPYLKPSFSIGQNPAFLGRRISCFLIAEDAPGRYSLTIMRAPTYTVQKIEPLPGCDRIEATGLNRFGQVAGNCYAARDTLPGPIRIPATRAFFRHQQGHSYELKGFNQHNAACGINDRGDVVGYAEEYRRTGLGQEDRLFTQVPVLWVGSPDYKDVDREPDARTEYGSPESVPMRLPDVLSGAAYALNTRREVVGGPDALWLPARARQIKLHRQRPPQKGKGLRIVGINERASMIAVSWFVLPLTDVIFPHAPDHAFWAREGRWSRLTTPGVPDSEASQPRGINNQDLVVGWVQSGPRYPRVRPWVWRGGKGEPLGDQPGEAAAVNDAGQIVGFLHRDERKTFACLWLEGKPIDLNDCVPPGTYLASAEAINNRGQILVNNEGEAAYLLTPK